MSNPQAKQVKQHKEHIKQQTEFVNFLQQEVNLIDQAYDLSNKIGMSNETHKILKEIIEDKIKQLHVLYFKDKQGAA